MARAAPILLIIALVLMAFHFPMTKAALTNVDVDPNEGVKGDVIVITGSGVIASVTVELYWDLVQDWDGKSGLLNTTIADPDGTFEI